MSRSIDLIHLRIVTRFSQIDNAIRHVQNEEKRKKIQNIFDEIQNSYYAKTCHLLIDSGENDSVSFLEYNNVVHSENIFNKVNDLSHATIDVLKEQSEKNTANLYADTDKTSTLPFGIQPYRNKDVVSDTLVTSLSSQCDIPYEIRRVKYDQCACGGQMEEYPSSSELICKRCHAIVNISGKLFKTSQIYNQDGPRSKHGSYDVKRHQKTWMDRIQAKETVDVSECVELINICRIRDDLPRLTCNKIREYLKEIGMTQFNYNVPLIRKKITGISPPQYTCEEERLIGMYFANANVIFDQIKPNSVSNNPYHPYFIFKIIEYVFRDDPRKVETLSCIHLQSDETLYKNDLYWQEICKHLPEIKYIPTDPSDYDV